MLWHNPDIHGQFGRHNQILVVLLKYKLCNVYSDMTSMDTIKLDLANARIPTRMLRRK